MPQDVKIWRHNARRKLIEFLGGQCFHPGCECPVDKLTFDHHNPPLTEEEHKARVRMGATHRMVLYRKHAREGRLRLACQKHNNLARDMGPAKDDDENNPF